jgi:hypothetical protein
VQDPRLVAEYVRLGTDERMDGIGAPQKPKCGRAQGHVCDPLRYETVRPFYHGRAPKKIRRPSESVLIQACQIRYDSCELQRAAPLLCATWVRFFFEFTKRMGDHRCLENTFYAHVLGRASMRILIRATYIIDGIIVIAFLVPSFIMDVNWLTLSNVA